MDPAPHLGDALFPEQLIVTAIGIGVHIALVADQKVQRPFFAPVQRKVVYGQGRIGISPHIDPQPCLFHPAVALDLQRDDGIVGKQDFEF